MATVRVSVADSLTACAPRLLLEEGKLIHGRLLYEDGTGVQGATVRLGRTWDVYAEGGLGRSVDDLQLECITNEDGEFSFLGLPDAQFSIVVDGSTPLCGKERVEAGGPAVVLTLPNGISVSGEVRARSGRACEAFWIQVMKGRSEIMRPFFSGRGGRFEIVTPMRGSYSIRAIVLGGGGSEPIPIDGSSAGIQDLILRVAACGSLKGNVRLEEGRGNALVILAPMTSRGAMRRTTADDDGGFLFRALPVGRYQISVLLEHFVALRQVVDVSEGVETDVQLSVGRLGSLSIAVSGSGGLPSSHMRIELRDLAGRPVDLANGSRLASYLKLVREGARCGVEEYVRGVCAIDAGGHVELGEVAPGEYVVNLVMNDSVVDSARVVISAGKVTEVRFAR